MGSSRSRSDPSDCFRVLQSPTTRSNSHCGLHNAAGDGTGNAGNAGNASLCLADENDHQRIHQNAGDYQVQDIYQSKLQNTCRDSAGHQGFPSRANNT
mmetsp:Transcript_8582/g.19878  ORF Transcript_8582/g.19878 Transcript_8582/m.19878 type:complete len:98 (+) Transcript_8582:130-423(+)